MISNTPGNIHHVESFTVSAGVQSCSEAEQREHQGAIDISQGNTRQ
jgi:hypothetical protein